MRKLFPIAFLFSSIGSLCYGQTGTLCSAIANPPVVRAEGVTEQTGDIVMNCTGGTPNAVITGTLTLSMVVNVTNHLTAGGAVDVFLTADNGGGPAPVAAPATLVAPNRVAFNGLSFTLSSAGTVNLHLSNLRAAVSDAGPGQQITVLIAFNGNSVVTFPNVQLRIAFPLPGLLATINGALFCSQRGSPLPAAIGFTNLLSARTGFSSTRVTEAFPSAFEPKGPNLDNGLRIVARFSNIPHGARLFVPDAVAGSDAVVPTSGGDMGEAASGGQYMAGSGALLLIRVRGTDPNGAGGNFAVLPPAFGTVAFDSVNEVDYQPNGGALAVYEVVASNSAKTQSAQFPTFLGLAPGVVQDTVTIGEQLSLGPLSTTDMASTSAPILRFIAANPPSDCGAIGDCNAPYFPHLFVDTTPLNYIAVAGSGLQVRYVHVGNLGGGVLNWAATATYTEGDNWLILDPASGINGGNMGVYPTPANLTAGTYHAVVTVDAGPQGSREIPVTLTVTPAPPPPVIKPIINSLTNSASLAPGPIVAGSLATIMGSKLAGTQVTVTLDSTTAVLLYKSATQINLQVPPGVGSKTSAQVVVTADGVASDPFTATLAPFAPAIFPGAVLNLDYSQNTQQHPAKLGGFVVIYATGLPANNVISAKIGNRVIPLPAYGGPAPGLIGVQQVNIHIPEDLDAGTTNVYVCGAAAWSDPAVCSPPAPLYLAH